VSNICYDNSNWTERLENAKEAGYFTDEDRVLSSYWETCAIGERMQKRGAINWKKIRKYLGENGVDGLGRYIRHQFSGVVSNGNLDFQAYDLGMRFMRAVDASQVNEAIELYKQIVDLRIILKTDRSASPTD